MKKLVCLVAFAASLASAQSPTPQYLTGDAVGNFNAVLNVAAAPYKAVGDAQVVTDGAITAASHALTSASGRFTAATCAARKVISVQYAGGTAGSNQPLVTTCTYVSPTQVTLAAAATQTATAAGVIWGTDNRAAFQAWAAALPGHAGVIPAGNFLINTQGNTQLINLGSNEEISMNRNGAIYQVGASLNSGTYFFYVPSGTSNLTVDRFHVIGEWQNTATSTGVGQALGYAAVFGFGNTTTSTHHLKFTNGIYENLLGIGIIDFGVNDYDIDIENNAFNHDANTGINVNVPQTTIAGNNFNFDGLSECIESSAPQSQIKNNICVNAGSQYAMAIGGDTGGTPYKGTQVTGNLILNPNSALGCMSVGDAFTYGLIADNLCLGLSKTGQLGFSNVYTGFTTTGHNVFQNNGVTSSTGLASAFYNNQANDDIYRNNWTDSTVDGLTVQSATGINSTQNTFNFLHLQGTAAGRFQDYLISGVYTLGGSSTFSNDTVLSGPSGIVYSGPPASVFSSAVVAPSFTTLGNSSSGNATHTPFNSTTGTTGGYNLFTLFNQGGGSSNANNAVIDFGVLGVSPNNSHTWAGAEYNTNFSSDFAVFTAKGGNTALNPYDAIRAFTLYSDPGNTFAYGWLKGSLHVGATSHNPGSGSIEYEAQLVGPATAPSGACSGAQIGWQLTGDGAIRYCNGSVWSAPAFAAANIAGGATGSLTYQSAANTTTFISSPTTSGHYFVPAWTPSGSAVAPAAIDLGTYLNANITTSLPIVFTPTALGFAVSCPTCGSSTGGTAVTVNGGGALASLDINAAAPVADASFLALTPKISGGSVIIEAPYATGAAFGVLKCGTGTSCASGVISNPSVNSGMTNGQVAIASGATTLGSSVALGSAASNIPQLDGSGKLVSSEIPNNAANTSGNASTASALAASPTTCGAGQAPRGIDASGAPQNCTTYVQAICSGTITLSTAAVALNSTFDNTATCTGLLTTDNIKIDFASNPTAVTGYGVTGDDLTLSVYPSSNTIHVVQGNNVHNSGSITPGAMTVNYRVFR